MGRTTVFLGAPVEGVNLNTNGAQRSTWPDLDTDGNFAPFPSAKFATCKALALAAATDWDLVRVITSGNVEELLGPGRLLVLKPGDTVVDIQPVIAMPATRLYSGKLQHTGTLPQLRSDWKIGRLDGTGINPAWFIYNATGSTLPWWQWNGTTWVGGGTSAANNGVFTLASVNLLLDSAENNSRATDYSPDGVWSFADYAENGALLFDDGTTPAKGSAFVSSFAFGNLGTPGDASGGFATIHFAFRWGNLSALFYGRLAVDIFDTDCPDWAPRLPPQRQLTLPAYVVGNTGAVAVDQVLCSIPAFNVERICWTLANTGGSGAGSHSVYATIVLPVPSDALSSLAGVTVLSDGTHSFDTIVSADEGAVLYTNVTHPLVKFLLGSDGGATIAAGSIITITRRVTH